MNESDELTVLIADDHPVVRQGLRDALLSAPEFRVIGEAADGAEAWALIERLKPATAVLDIKMPKLDGLEVARLAQRHGLEVAMVVLTMYEEEELFNAAIDAGVMGYVLKENATAELVACLRSVASGKTFICPALSDLLLRRRSAARAIVKRKPGLADLTEVERRILARIAEGDTSKDIADVLEISYRTIENHRYRIAEKLDLHGTNALMKFAFENKSRL